ncbi:protein-export chaperone SecB [Alphaproteobacteria bacterium]|nr:protein-export chaperone SecB [Alphaproteobacteria bacterium]
MTNVNVNDEPSVEIVRHYIKDLSFENPQSIQDNNFENNNNCNISQNMSFVQTSFKNNFFSIVVKYTCDCSSKKTGNKLLVLELDYFGFFKILNNNSYNQDYLTKTGAKLILPFVRSIIEDITNKGGSVMITLKDVDFDLIKS